MIISFKLLLYCLLFAGAYLLLIDLLWSKLEQYLPMPGSFPKDLIEPRDIGWFLSAFIIEFLFFVLMPAVVYGWFYTVIPFSGIKGGISVGLYLIFFGILPMVLLLLFRIKIPLVFMLYQLLGFLIKLIGAMAIIGYLYSL